jgi:hypothetical protein
MATGKSKGGGKVELLCDDCGVEIFVDTNMVMIKDDLWLKVNDGKMEGALCDKCIEKKLGRPIEVSDFKPSDGIYGTAPCNIMWLEENRR